MKKLSSLLTINFFLISAAFLAQQNNSASLLNKADSIYFSNPDSSYTLSCLAEDYAKKANDKTALAKAYLYKGRYFLLKSDLEEADVLVNKSLTLYKDVSDWNGLAYASKLKAILEKRLGNNKQATAYTEEAVSLYKKVNDTKGTVSGLLNLSLDYIDNKQYDKAEEVLNEVENYIKQVSASNMYYYYQNKGKLKLALNKYPAAITDFSKALEVAEAQQMVDSKATILTHLAKAYRLNKQTVDAAHYINESKEIAEKNKLDNELSDAYEELILLQRDLGNYKEAFEYLLLQNSLKSKMVNIEKINHISMLEKKLALSEKQKEIEQEKLKAQHAKENSEQLMYLAGCITLVALLAIFMFIRTRKLHRKIIIQNKKLELKNHIIEEKQKEILDSIHYAKRIQNALITSERSIDNSLKKLMKGK